MERFRIGKECIYGKSSCRAIEILSHYVVINTKSDIAQRIGVTESMQSTIERRTISTPT